MPLPICRKPFELFGFQGWVSFSPLGTIFFSRQSVSLRGNRPAAGRRSLAANLRNKNRAMAPNGSRQIRSSKC